jgi:L-asparaginase
MSLPRVSILSLGGTIAMAGQGASGVVPALSAEDLVAAVPVLAEVASIEASSFRMVPSAHLKLDDVVALAGEVVRRVGSGADGVVVTQGTDTLEEVVFALDLLLEADAPVVVTGAMRNPTLPGADGPANLLASVRVAASQVARGLGALVVLNDEIHAARFVQKTHSASPAAFQSPITGPIGWVAEGTPRVVLRPPRRHRVAVPADAPDRPVALVTAALGDDGRTLDALERLGYEGLVVEAFGGGHLPDAWMEALSRLAASMPVVYASRTGRGEMLRGTYGFPGSETDLRARGLIPAGFLDGPKARVLLSLLLRGGAPREEMARAFEGYLRG